MDLRSSIPGFDELPLGEQISLQKEIINRVVFGKDPQGNRLPVDPANPSMWDVASKNFVDQATGDFRIVAGAVTENSILMQTELTALVAKSGNFKVDGLDINHLRTLAPEAGKNAVLTNAITQTALSLPDLSESSLSRFRSSTPDSIAAALRDPSRLLGLDMVLDGFPASLQQRFDAGQAALIDAGKSLAGNGLAKGLNKLGLVGGVLGFVLAAGNAAAAQADGNTEQAQAIMQEWAVDFAGSEIGGIAGAAVAGIAVGIAAALGLTVTAPLAAAVIFGGMLVGGFMGADMALGLFREMDLSASINSYFNAARSFVPQRDPLVLDLDGDGLELSAANGQVLFDHNADGIRTGTGWALPDDAFLVRDLNGNGLIDSGRELFGVDTLKSNGQLATQGFDALADLDSNRDGQISALDSDWQELKAWRDLDQNGVAQPGELLRLDQLGITRIGLDGRATGPQAGQTINNNRVALSTTFTLNGVDRTVGAIDLEVNGFFSDIAPEVLDEEGQAVSLTDAALALPQMNGAGMVRDLRSAMSLSGRQAEQLREAVHRFAAASSRTEQLALIDTLVKDWAQTSSFHRTLEGYLNTAVQLVPPAGMTAEEYRTRIGVLEAFNGVRFYGAQGQAMPAGQTSVRIGDAWVFNIHPPAAQAALLQQAYTALKDSVYEALTLQTRLKPYLSAVTLTVDEQGLRFDSTGLVALLQARYASQPQCAIEDLVELNRFAGTPLHGIDFYPVEILRAWKDALPANDPLHAVFAQLQVLDAATFLGTDRADIYLGDAAGNVFSAGAGDDVLDGGAGADVLQGGGGDDVLFGGRGNDTLVGGTHDAYWGSFQGAGNDTYRFNRGDGQDTIKDNDTRIGNLDKLVFGPGIRPAQLSLSRTASQDLVLKLNGSTDQVTLHGYFISDASTGWTIEEIRFVDEPGTVWSVAEVKRRMLTGTSGDDTVLGYASDDELFGLDGKDRLSGDAGNDLLDGGAGADTLLGGAGNDTLLGGADADWLEGGEGENVLWGAAGNDVLVGGAHDAYWGTFASRGSDTYLFGRGDGQDAIYDHDTGSGRVDRLIFKAGILPTDVSATRSANGHLLLQIKDSTDQVSVANYFANDAAGGWQIEEIGFEDDPGTVWSVADVKRMQFQSGQGPDVLIGYASDDTLFGYEGNDSLSGGAGNDTLDGGAGHDRLLGEDGRDTLVGAAGDDVLLGGADNDQLMGGADADSLEGGAGHDTLHGGTGDDTLNGGSFSAYWGTYSGAGNDTYRFERGDGRDTILDFDTSVGNLDTLVFGAGILPSDLSVSRDLSQNLLLKLTGGTDVLNVRGYFISDGASGWGVEEIRFGDDATTVWRVADVMRMALTGGAGNDVLTGYASDDLLMGHDGQDSLNGEGGNDRLEGGNGADSLKGGAGNDHLAGGADADHLQGGAGSDTLHGGLGDDVLVGGTHDAYWNTYNSVGNDTYLLGRGDGADRIYDTDSTLGNRDVLRFLEDISEQQLWLRRAAYDLELSVIGTGDKMTISNWYAGAQFQVERFELSDGQALLASQVNALVDAMAAFAPPPLGQTTLMPAQQAALTPLIAASWT